MRSLYPTLPRARAEAGFTLAETMVALFILALVSAAGSGLLLGAIGAGKQVRSREAVSRQIDVAQALIRGDIAALSARAIRPDDGFSRPGNLFGGARGRDGDVLAFVRSGWLNPGQVEARSDLQAVRYRLEDGVLVREVTVRPDAVPGTPVSRRVLLRGVARVTTRFLRGGEWSSEWIGDAGQALDVLPDLIELEIAFDDQTRLSIAALTGGRS